MFVCFCVINEWGLVGNLWGEGVGAALCSVWSSEHNRTRMHTRKGVYFCVKLSHFWFLF